MKYALTSEWHAEGWDEIDSYEIEQYDDCLELLKMKARELVIALYDEFSNFEPDSWFRVDIWEVEETEEQFEETFGDQPESLPQVFHFNGEF